MGQIAQHEVNQAREIFSQFDKDGSGTIDSSELKHMLHALGHDASDEEVFLMISLVDEDNSGAIEFPEMIQVLEKQKQQEAKAGDETDTVDAFVALGGNRDCTGTIAVNKLRDVCHDFGLTVDVDELLRNANVSTNSGSLDFSQFKRALSN